MLEVCRLSPAPALQLGVADGEFEINAAARDGNLTSAYGPDDWRELAERVRRDRATRSSGAGTFWRGVGWVAVEIEGGGCLAWLVPDPAASAQRDPGSSDPEAGDAVRLLTDAGIAAWRAEPVGRTLTWYGSPQLMFGSDAPSTLHIDEARDRLAGRLHPDDRAGVAHAFETAREPWFEGAEWSFRVVDDDGSVRWLVARARRRDVEGLPHATTGVVIDVTEQRLAQERLTEAQKLGRRRASAEAANLAKSRFLADMSHEIRTPMNAILGMAHLALRTELDPRQHNYVEKIERSAQGLLGLVNEILDFSKIEAGKLELERVEFRLAAVFEDLVDLIGLQAEERQLALRIGLSPSLPAVLVGDPGRLRQVLLNLLANAVKFTEPGGEVRVQVQARTEAANAGTAEAGGATLRFTVSDSGVGMTAQHLGRLFRPYEQAAASTARVHGGTGLGLAISQRLVEGMGGVLQVSSAPRLGTSFTFDLRFDVPEAGTAVLQALPAELAGRQVLVVDARADEGDGLLDLCAALGLDAVGVPDAWAALSAVAQAAQAGTPYDLAVIDTDIAAMGGLTCARELRSGAFGARPIVLTSTARARDNLQRDIAKSALLNVQVLVTPVLPAAWVAALAAAFGVGGVPAVAAPVAATVRAQLRGVQVLLVDDSEINRELACELLGAAGLAVTVAVDGQEAMALLLRRHFDVVLMDCQMPVMDGYEATAALRRDARWQQLPIIAMTADAMSEDRRRALACGMNDHIAKPIDVEAMFATLARWVPGAAAPNDPVTLPAHSAP